MAHPNEDLLRRGYAAFGAADLDTVFSVLADNIAWHNGGSNQLTGDSAATTMSWRSSRGSSN